MNPARFARWTAVVGLLATLVPTRADASDAAWSFVDSELSPSFYGSAYCTDTRRSRLMIYGGTHLTQRSSHLFSYDFATREWRRLASQGAPPPALTSAIAIYDSLEDRMLVFGGETGHVRRPVRGVWSYSIANGGTWTEIETSGEIPPAMLEHVGVLDPLGRRLIVYGGRDSLDEAIGDVWSLSIDAPHDWKLISPAGTRPPARFMHSGAYVPTTHSLVIWGGSGDPFSTLSPDVYELNLAGPSVWAKHSPVGPPGRWGCRAVYDPAYRRLLVTGGNDSPHETWGLTTRPYPEWSLLTSTKTLPDRRSFHCVAVDVSDSSFMITGGQGTDPSDSRVFRMSSAAPGEGYSVVNAPSNDPRPTERHLAHWDAPRSRLLIFAGVQLPNFSFGVDAWSPDSGWTHPVVGGIQPPPRYFTAWASVSSRNSLWLWGGAVENNVTQDMRELSLYPTLAWTARTALNSPSPRYGHSLSYSPVRDELMLFGSHLRDARVHLLSPNTLPLTWTTISPPGPLGRFGHSAVHDSRRDRVLIYGGDNASDECWAFDFGTRTWTQIAWTGDSPGGRIGHQAVYDSTTDRMIVIGGERLGTNLPLNEVWSLDIGGGSGWRLLDIAPENPDNSYFATGYDRVLRRAISHGGRYGLGVEEIAFTPATTSVGLSRGEKLELTASPNPTRTSWSAQFVAHEAGPWQMRLVDLQGRVLLQFSGSASSGETVKRRVSPSRLPSGLYWLQLTTAGRPATSLRLVHLD